MEIKTNALVLRTTQLPGNKLIVDLLTREAGRLSVLCRVSRSGRGAVKKQFFQPLSILDVDVEQKPTATLARFKDVRLALPYVSIQTDMLKLPLALFLAEFLTYATRDEQRNPLLYDYVEQSLNWLDNATSHFANFHLTFMMHLSLFIGFYPNLHKESDDEWFDLRSGSFTNIRPSHPDALEPAEADKIKILMRMNYENMHLFKMTREERNRCVSIILYYYRLHIPNFPELRSLSVLQSLFD
ncbi:MAG: DNA repair protein RecO [Prevotella sp.]|jgi:DNA repair protein RecO (recombination protein O)